MVPSGFGNATDFAGENGNQCPECSFFDNALPPNPEADTAQGWPPFEIQANFETLHPYPEAPLISGAVPNEMCQFSLPDTVQPGDIDISNPTPSTDYLYLNQNTPGANVNHKPPFHPESISSYPISSVLPESQTNSAPAQYANQHVFTYGISSTNCGWNTCQQCSSPSYGIQPQPTTLDNQGDTSIATGLTGPVNGVSMVANTQPCIIECPSSLHEPPSSNPIGAAKSQMVEDMMRALYSRYERIRYMQPESVADDLESLACPYTIRYPLLRDPKCWVKLQSMARLKAHLLEHHFRTSSWCDSCQQEINEDELPSEKTQKCLNCHLFLHKDQHTMIQWMHLWEACPEHQLVLLYGILFPGYRCRVFWIPETIRSWVLHFLEFLGSPHLQMLLTYIYNNAPDQVKASLGGSRKVANAVCPLWLADAMTKYGPRVVKEFGRNYQIKMQKISNAYVARHRIPSSNRGMSKVSQCSQDNLKIYPPRQTPLAVDETLSSSFGYIS
ncbi:hypothetical protein PT974_03691 [Cladobotryum mycophilum]|uniref:Uncharacterized protein n=1 Tax=Cladobotryum mycophilum TaxID=491253 RepID=A0ABR0ST03_9HYPO